MNRKEAIKEFQTQIDTLESMIAYNKDFEPKSDNSRLEERMEAAKIAISALEELERWHTDHINERIKNPFAWTSTLICHNCDHKDEYIEELEAEVEESKEAIRKLLCSEYGSSCQFCIQDKNENAMCCKVGGSGSWCCENAAWNGKGHD